MELFTLGADRGAYTETDVRELAKCAHRLARRLVRRHRLGELPLRRQPLGPGTKTVFGKSGRVHVGGRRQPRHLRTRCTRRSSSRSSGATSSRRRRAPTSPPRSRRATSSSGHQIRPVVEAILCSPEFYEGPRWSSRRSCSPPACCARWTSRSTTSAWVWLTTTRPAALLPARRRRLGRHALAGHQHGPRAAGRSSTRRCAAKTITSATWGTYQAETADEAVTRARAFWGNPRLTGETVAVLRALRRHRTVPGRRRAARAPRAASERPAPADRRVPRLPDLLRKHRHACTATTSPAPRSCAPARPPGRQRPARDRARHADARRNGAEPPLVPRPLRRARARRLRRRGARARRSWRTASPGRRGGRRAARARLDLLGPAAPTRFAAGAARRLPLRARCARRSSSRSAQPARRLRRGLPAALAPGPRAAARPAPRRQGQRAPAVGYDGPNQSHFTSRHYWEVGEIDPPGRIGWMGRFLDRHGSAGQPAPGALARLQPGARARAGERARRRVSRRRRTTASGRATCGTTRSTRCYALRGARAGCRPPTPPWRARARRERPRRCTTARAALQPRPGAWQAAAAIRDAHFAAPARRARRDARAGPAAAVRRARRQRRLRHARGAVRHAARRLAGWPPRSPRSRPTSSRAASPTAS